MTATPSPGTPPSTMMTDEACLPELMSPGDARRALSALRARINSAGPALLENGLPITSTVLDRAGALRTARARLHHPLHTGPARPRAALGRAGMGLAPQSRRPSLGSSGSGHRRGLPVNALLDSNWTLHDLRRTAAYRMARDRKLALTDVQWVLGHGHLST
ncbi:hypothetical protein ACFWWM_30695 [Streptomyces sp. NPDC058682]|uniref:hypothetical protein n=1 Tax=Streptomyces sp. NPDC058682 TaxID=3346596 RepID=UPI0036643EEF